MARKKVTLAYIANEKKRNTSFVKRKKGLFTKLKQVTTLCDVEACAIIYGQHATEPDVWPSTDGAHDVLARFYALSERERAHKMVNHEIFAQMQVDKMRNKVDRIRRENKLTRVEGFVYKCRAGDASLDVFNMLERDEMEYVIDRIMLDLTSRIESLKIMDPAHVARVAESN